MYMIYTIYTMQVYMHDSADFGCICMMVYMHEMEGVYPYTGVYINEMRGVYGYLRNLYNYSGTETYKKCVLQT